MFIGISEDWEWHGCRIENITAEAYGIKSYKVPVKYVDAVYEKLRDGRPKGCTEN